MQRHLNLVQYQTSTMRGNTTNSNGVPRKLFEGIDN
jgi:hypothetical protein